MAFVALQDICFDNNPDYVMEMLSRLSQLDYRKPAFRWRCRAWNVGFFEGRKAPTKYAITSLMGSVGSSVSVFAVKFGGPAPVHFPLFLYFLEMCGWLDLLMLELCWDFCELIKENDTFVKCPATSNSQTNRRAHEIPPTLLFMSSFRIMGT